MLAYRLANLPVGIVTGIFGTLLFPVYSKINRERPHVLEATFIKAVNIGVVMLLLILVPMKLLAAELILFLYGEKWRSAMPLLAVLLLLGLFRVT